MRGATETVVVVVGLVMIMNLDTHTLWFEAERDRQTRLVGCWMDDDFGHAKMSHQYVDTRDHCGLMLSSTSSSSQVGLQRYLGTFLVPSLWSLGCQDVTGCLSVASSNYHSSAMMSLSRR